MSVPVIEILKSIPEVFGVQLGEQPKFDLIDKDGAVEIRRYAPFRIAKTYAQGDYRTAMHVGFCRLAKYIFGANKENKQMAMTAPVFQKSKENGWAMSFVMPEKYPLDELPEPGTPNIELDEVPGHLVAVLRYSGDNSEQAINDKKKELLDWVRLSRYAPEGEVFAAQYDPPFTISFLKHNEVMVRLAEITPRRLTH